MTRHFDVGPGARCDIDALVDTRLLVQANSGGGKSWLLRRILEQTFGKVQHLVIDPEGEFSTLRERFDYVLAAKAGGDTVADPRSAKLLAERLLELKASAILDIYELKAHDRVRFVRSFLEALVDAPKKLWHPVLVVVDEAHVFCPQVGEAESAGAVIDLATRGRKRGFAALLATQRLSKLHKDAAAECNNVLIGRTGLDVDMKRAADTLGLVGREEMHALRELKPGEFHAFGPAFDPLVRHVVVGPVTTSHPKAGSRIAFTAPPPTDKVRALLPQLADLPAEAEAKVKTEAELRAEIATLRREVIRLSDARPEARIERVEVPTIVGHHVTELVGLLGDVAGAGEKIQGFAQRVLDEIAKAQRSMPTIAERVPFKVPERGAIATTVPSAPLLAPRTAGERRAAKRNAERDASELSGPEQRILDSLAWFQSIGVGEVENAAAAFGSGYTVNGSYFNNRAKLKARGLVEYLAGDKLRLTDEGIAAANVPERPATNKELHERVLSRLDGPGRRVLTPLLEQWPDVVANDQLAEAAGYTLNGSYFNARGRLKSCGLIEYVGGNVRARDILFPESR